MSIDRSTALRFLAAGLAGLTISVFAPGIDGPLWAAILPAMIMASAIGVVAVQPRFRAQAAVTYLGMLAVTEAVRFVTVAAATNLSPVNELSGRLTVAAHLAILTVGWVIAALVTATGFTYTWARRRAPRTPAAHHRQPDRAAGGQVRVAFEGQRASQLEPYLLPNNRD